MKLYSVQPLAVYDLLCREGLFHSRPQDYPDSALNLFNDDFKFAVAYQWLIERMIERGLARPHPEVFPVWAYLYWINRAKPKPDLRYTALKRWGKSGRQVLLTMIIPDDRVLLSDYDQWFSCLCYGPAGSVRDMEAFWRRSEKLGPRPYDQPYPEPFHQELLDTWRLVLDLAAARKKNRISKANQCIQATFWELTADQVTEAVAFGDGRPRERLPLPGRRKGPRRGYPRLDG